MNLKNIKGYGYTDVIVGVSILALVALGSIKLIELKYSKSYVGSQSIALREISEILRNGLRYRNSCERTFKRYNLLKKNRISHVFDKNGKVALKVGQYITNDVVVRKMRSENVNLMPGTRGKFYLIVEMYDLAKKKAYATRILVDAWTNLNGKTKECFFNDGNIFKRTILRMCRSLEND